MSEVSELLDHAVARLWDELDERGWIEVREVKLRRAAALLVRARLCRVTDGVLRQSTFEEQWAAQSLRKERGW